MAATKVTHRLARKYGNYTTSTAFLEAISEAGITHCFVNLGSDHPSILEAMVEAQHGRATNFPRIITCPSEMVAMSMADGYARLTNKPQCVIVHVDVGTQALGAAIHNASVGRAPVLVFAGLSPSTMDGEYRGSRTEYIHWLQDVPDQKQIVAQYCRFTGEIKRGANVKQMINRALQFATSDPMGPVYLYGSREALEEEITPYTLDSRHWKSVSPGALNPEDVRLVADHLAAAKTPLMIVGFTGRRPSAVYASVALANMVPGLRVIDTGGSDMSFPADHAAFRGLRVANDDVLTTADFILVVDCDVPWIPTQRKPRPETKVIHIDVDPLKQQMPVFYFQALARFRADATTSLNQILDFIKSDAPTSTLLQDSSHLSAGEDRKREWERRQTAIKTLAQPPTERISEAPINVHFLAAQIRATVPEDTVFAVEAVTLAASVADQIAPVLPRSWINCGGGGLGWSGGGALGIKLATDFEHGHQAGDGSGSNRGRFVCQITGDGSYLFSVPGSVYWIARRYDIPVLTIVLNNEGWNAPRKSLLLVHPAGSGSRVDNRSLNISFDPSPDYAGIARAASGGWAWAGCVGSVANLLAELPGAVQAVKEGRSAVLGVQLDRIGGKLSPR